jgi:glutamyl/glutaminyl-tRNA synthetase
MHRLHQRRRRHHHRSAGHRGARHQERHPRRDSVKVKAAITWVGVADGVNAEVRMYDRLFLDAQPDAGGKDFLESLNPNSLKVITAIVEPSLANAAADQKFQFERHGYFVADVRVEPFGGGVEG